MDAIVTAMSQHLGYAGSFLVHGALVAAALAFAATPDPFMEPPPRGEVVITPGGAGGADGGPAPGPRGPSKPAPARFTPLRPIDADRVLRDYAESVQRAEAAAKARALADAGAVARPTSKPRPSTPAVNTMPAPGATRAIIGATMPVGDHLSPGGSGPTSGPSGRPGDANGVEVWSAGVRSAFAAAYAPRVRALGGTLPDEARGVVRIRISLTGDVAFDGWQEAPAAPALAAAVRQAVDAMGPVPAPPAGATVVVVPFAAQIDGR